MEYITEMRWGDHADVTQGVPEVLGGGLSWLPAPRSLHPGSMPCRPRRSRVGADPRRERRSASARPFLGVAGAQSAQSPVLVGRSFAARHDPAVRRWSPVVCAQTDPLSRQIPDRHGCFLDPVDGRCRCRRLAVETTLFPMGEWRLDRPVALIRFHPVDRDHARACSTGAAPPHREACLRRSGCSSRRTRRPLRWPSSRAWPGCRSPTSPRTSPACAPCRVRQRAQMNLPRTHKESIDVVRIGHCDRRAPRRHLAHRADDLGAAAGGSDDGGKRTDARHHRPGTVAATTSLPAASVPAFGWMSTPDNARPTQIAVGRAFRLQSLPRRAWASLCSRTARPCRNIPRWPSCKRR